MAYVFPLLVLAAMIFAVVDIIMRDDAQIRFMPKALWLILVILVPLVGVILWFVLGREHVGGSEPVVRMPRPRAPRRAEPPTAPPVPPGPGYDRRTTEQQLADLEREIEEERLRAELRRRKQGGERSGQ
ncbi:PLD nuclease N-terminal domain-containing protein [Microbacterium horticulturae]|uniref:PLD nuclease N-terminal domain-containing protein n=1 Tax=Microbacterium horticulturae TaxID=3028316 RepID=A0ABY8C0N5_9MICO|nr:PLD nuclease N-terminal domain-containing protein [Microbacterium sp. KACC 23027]WEG09983.1 PLD nuclease N-terminal domain-containing protein [Microbacterium sp. KACC 23027]